MHIINPVILCGGSGTRLWPLSTTETPKQFLALTSDKSMIAETAARFSESLDQSLAFSQPLIVGSMRHAALLDAQLPGTRQILEPFGRNSAPAVAAACLAHDSNDLVLILPADHDVRDLNAFHSAIAIATRAALEGSIVTFGIVPTHPATGYGYIRADTCTLSNAALSVERFVEKPTIDHAEAYLADGAYFWNAGIFLFRVQTMLDAIAQHAPAVLEGVRAAIGDARKAKVLLDPQAFAKTPSISIDYAVMEHASNVKTVPVSMGWSDVGSYRALHELLSISESANYSSGPVFIQNSEGVYVRSEGPIVTVNGISNLAVVATDSEVMITPLDQDGAVKSLGNAALAHRHKLGFSEQRAAAAQAWLWNALDIWSERAWDSQRGGFVEQLASDGTPDFDQDRRIRVQARQIFAFSKAIDLGWSNKEKATALVNMGLDYLDTKLRHPSGGWIHVASADGQPRDDRRDLYDHAFIILAGATAFKATSNPLAARIAHEALTFIETEMKDTQHGGWLEVLPHVLPRRANPHMHLLEAMLALHQATGSEVALRYASEAVRLFETKFFDPGTDTMAETFEHDWCCSTSREETVFEPGHHYEWATLLHQFESITGHDTLSWRRRLIRKADQVGICLSTGFAMNAVRANGEVIDGNSRLWHQLEMLRAHLYHPELAPRRKVEGTMNAIFKHYLSAAPKGCWLDEIDSKNQPVSNHIPASMLYHAITAFAPLMD